MAYSFELCNPLVPLVLTWYSYTKLKPESRQLLPIIPLLPFINTSSQNIKTPFPPQLKPSSNHEPAQTSLRRPLQERSYPSTLAAAQRREACLTQKLETTLLVQTKHSLSLPGNPPSLPLLLIPQTNENPVPIQTQPAHLRLQYRHWSPLWPIPHLQGIMGPASKGLQIHVQVR